MSFAQAPNDPGLSFGLKVVASVVAYTLINGTGNILTFTTPNDGKLHPVFVCAELTTTLAETGGQITVASTANGNNLLQQLFAAGLGGGNVGNGFNLVCDPNSNVVIAQGSALTAGASTMAALIAAL